MRTVKLLFTIMLVFLFFSLAHAQTYTDTSGIGSALTNVINWLTKVLGGAMTVIGMIVVGIRMAAHDPEALKKGLWVVVGGLFIFLSMNILTLIQKLAGQ